MTAPTKIATETDLNKFIIFGFQKIPMSMAGHRIKKQGRVDARPFANRAAA
jgi:hypothetical protein